ncbi:hydroxymethylpyrimidine kinase/phosphomethylpyrimidine kinase/thiamine-phosphate diphosphorylase [Paucibacter oligotrophus]|uniref:Hydroxymethylpyrimidine kinase/phosphomethylpyrimidine kinase/thiamine-phosphate diphosphorylase n=1 Tax=Roseateles oligotrophus TaxID=1769250 RepID=A0A840LD00_9BURK|nr:bifunctional hydroxymethylpyrimidine kinase/phosphomethylpyrimidine kinase [Roseateles oligotrophus]MBB4844563.1 hydroxymethylpyrimidine kinase/phosphomethylpyrimidine kinase/thiamine-phosphate diphosphorylase [Roseateles oligotrophus]
MTKITHDLPSPCLPPAWPEAPDDRPPIVWAIAGTDSGGGAGLAADTRAAAALGVHLCPVVAAVTAQNSLGVAAVFPLPPEQLRAQLQALAQDLRPRVIKCGLLASAAALACVAQCVDDLRQQEPVALVIDPVLGATAGGAAFADANLLQAYREHLLPRATLITPNRREALRLLQWEEQGQATPLLAQALRELGAQAVCITGGDDIASTPGAEGLSLDWLDAQLLNAPVQGWLALPRLRNPHHHGSGCTFASAAAGALALGYPVPDAVVLAKMLSWSALQNSAAAGAGAGPVRASCGFAEDARSMPVMGFNDEWAPEASTLARWTQVLRGEGGEQEEEFDLGLYAITDKAERVAELVGLGLRQIQLRIKAQHTHSELALQYGIQTALESTLGYRRGASQLWINDHWRLALDAGATALHLGQEDWAALKPGERTQILRSGAKLGLSSHSLWELARARGLAPHYIACGPVCATTTKDMPWQPQGLRNLAWWVRMAGRPVVAIGGLLAPAQVADCAAAGAAAACLVRALDAEAGAGQGLAAFEEAWRQGRARRGAQPRG